MTENTVTVDKRIAATCQLETAIKLFLENRDLVSAYTLCCAADGILEGIYTNERGEILQKNRDQSSTPDNMHFSVVEEMEIRIKPEHRNEVFRALNAPQNFFKHADRDHDSSYQFPDWELTGVRIVMAIMNYNLVFSGTTPAMNFFVSLYAVLNPNLLIEGDPLSIALTAMHDFRALSREEIAAGGYSALKATCPRLFEQRPVTSSS